MVSKGWGGSLTEPTTTEDDANLLPFCEIERIVGIIGRYRDSSDMSLCSDKKSRAKSMSITSTLHMIDVRFEVYRFGALVAHMRLLFDFHSTVHKPVIDCGLCRSTVTDLVGLAWLTGKDMLNRESRDAGRRRF
jgi:hypothetical protein